MKEIQLNKGFVTKVDDEDFEWLNKNKWNIQEGRNFYARRTVTNKKITIYMHKEIAKKHGIIGENIDHIDRDFLNNQKSNLRGCTRSQNSKNRKPWGKSKYLGVSWTSAKKKWHVQIRIAINQPKSFGFFDDEKEAARTYNELAKKYHGEFANLNII